MSDFFLIDSSAWLAAVGPGAVPEIQTRVQGLIEQRLAAIAPPIYFELMSFPSADERLWKEILSSLRFYPLERTDWEDAANWTADLRRKGAKIRSMDALIAFIAHRYDLTLLHADADLDRLVKKAQFRVESHLQALRRWSAHHS